MLLNHEWALVDANAWVAEVSVFSCAFCGYKIGLPEGKGYVAVAVGVEGNV
jgi:hypothetical protein